MGCQSLFTPFIGATARGQIRVSGSFIIDGGIEVTLRRSARARRITLRVPRDGGPVVLTMPPRVAESQGRAFVQDKAGWIVRHVTERPVVRRPEHGKALPVEGRALTVTPAALRAARIEGDQLLVPQGRDPGPAAQALLKHLARARLAEACDRHAAALGRSFRAISLRDTRSRWGSCTSDGRLMFSWRLAMAPPEVLDYVAAHEVAHLAHMDHSPRFWAVVEQLFPHHAAQRRWLKTQGSELLLWQFRD